MHITISYYFLDGESIVTGAGDETLRFWNVFSKARSQKVRSKIVIYPRSNLKKNSFFCRNQSLP
jgi:WD40 repeat protein